MTPVWLPCYKRNTQNNLKTTIFKYKFCMSCKLIKVVRWNWG